MLEDEIKNLFPPAAAILVYDFFSFMQQRLWDLYEERFIDIILNEQRSTMEQIYHQYDEYTGLCDNDITR